MSGTASALGAAATFVWLGMVLAISFLEAPLKFRAPEVTLRIGLGIGRLVFRALNTAEVALATVVVIALAIGRPGTGAVLALGAAMVLLVLQLLAIRPALTRRSDTVLAGREGPRSRAHLWYVGAEAAKVVALVVGGVALLRA